MAHHTALEDIRERNAASELEGAVQVDRGRSASVTVGTDEIAAAQLGLSWFEPGVDTTTGCPALDLAVGEVTQHVADRWSRIAIGTLYVGVLHDGHHALALVEDSYSAESETCDDEHSCFFVQIDTLDAGGLTPRGRAITMLSSGEIELDSPLRINDTREPCASNDE